MFLEGKVGHLVLEGKVGQPVQNLLQVTDFSTTKGENDET